MADLSKVPITLGDMSYNRTGLWRYLMPAMRQGAAPCQAACPLRMPSPDFINSLLRRDAAGALQRIMEFNPLPGITGRLCYHPCQAKCLRRELDGNVHIQMLARHLADTAPAPPAGAAQAGQARVTVLGAGPLGLSAAYFLGRAGLAVTLRDPLDQPGGFLASMGGDKLPPEVLGRETSRLISLAGLKLALGDDCAALERGGAGQGWDLVIHDQTAHAPDSVAAQGLAALADQLSAEAPFLDSAGVAGQGAYKASQVAVALAAGRELAAQALNALGLGPQSDRLKELGQDGQGQEPISAQELRYEILAAQSQALSEDSVLAEAERCLSCGHCNLCGRCLMFCPDVSLRVNPQGTAPEVDEMHCKGCGICAHECPRRAIVMKR